MKKSLKEWEEIINNCVLEAINNSELYELCEEELVDAIEDIYIQPVWYKLTTFNVFNDLTNIKDFVETSDICISIMKYADSINCLPPTVDEVCWDGSVYNMLFSFGYHSLYECFWETFKKNGYNMNAECSFKEILDMKK